MINKRMQCCRRRQNEKEEDPVGRPVHMYLQEARPEAALSTDTATTGGRKITCATQQNAFGENAERAAFDSRPAVLGAYW